MTIAMRTALLIGTAAMFGGCAGMNTRANAHEAAQGQWTGVVMRSGLRELVAVDLEEVGTGWVDRLSAGVNSVPLDNVIVAGDTVHFDAPGEGSFDGTVAGDSMAGSLSGPFSGAFSLDRDRTNLYR